MMVKIRKLYQLPKCFQSWICRRSSFAKRTSWEHLWNPPLIIFIVSYQFLTVHLISSYCWWTKSCTTKDDNYPIIYRVLTIPGGCLGFRPSTVVLRSQRPLNPGFSDRPCSCRESYGLELDVEDSPRKSWRHETPGNFFGAKKKIPWAMNLDPGCLGLYTGWHPTQLDGDFWKSQYKDPYKPTSRMESNKEVFS